MDAKAPAPPRVSTRLTGDQLEISWSHENAADVFRWVVYYKRANAWKYTIANTGERSFSLPLFTTDLRAVKVNGRAPDGDEVQILGHYTVPPSEPSSWAIS